MEESVKLWSWILLRLAVPEHLEIWRLLSLSNSTQNISYRNRIWSGNFLFHEIFWAENFWIRILIIIIVYKIFYIFDKTIIFRRYLRTVYYIIFRWPVKNKRKINAVKLHLWAPLVHIEAHFLNLKQGVLGLCNL